MDEKTTKSLDFNFIDNIEVMERLGGNKALLKKLLKNFYDTYKNSDVEIMNLLRNGKYDDAFSLSHLIKGVAGNLSMKGLYTNANNLSEAIRNRDYTEIDLREIEFINSIRLIIEEIEKVKDLE